MEKTLTFTLKDLYSRQVIKKKLQAIQIRAENLCWRELRNGQVEVGWKSYGPKYAVKCSGSDSLVREFIDTIIQETSAFGENYSTNDPNPTQNITPDIKRTNQPVVPQKKFFDFLKKVR